MKRFVVAAIETVSTVAILAGAWLYAWQAGLVVSGFAGLFVAWRIEESK